MSGLIGGLISGAKALMAHQTGVEVAGRNLANVNTPGYARQRVILGDRVQIQSSFGSIGTGVEALGIKQIRDQFLDIAVIRETSQSARLQAEQSALRRAESNLGEQVDRSADSAAVGDAMHSTNGISAGLNDFFNAFDNLAANPTDAGARQSLLQKADLLANKFNVTDQRLSGLQGDLTAEIDTGVGRVNSLLEQIANLNSTIAQSELGAPGGAVGLRDERQARLEELATFMDFTTRAIPGSNGQIQIVAHDAGGADVLLVDRTSVLGGVTFNGTQFSGGVPAAPLAVSGGALAGLLGARDGTVQQLRDDLKRTADQLTTAVNAAYGVTGANFFETPPTRGLLALDPALNFNTLKATATGDAGANEVALAVSDVARRSFSTAGGDAINGTIGGFFNQTVSGLGGNLSNVNAKLSDQDIVAKMLTAQRDSVSGVSLDEEMADLMKFQRAYQASARVVRVMDEMLDGLINNMLR